MGPASLFTPVIAYNNHDNHHPAPASNHSGNSLSGLFNQTITQENTSLNLLDRTIKTFVELDQYLQGFASHVVDNIAEFFDDIDIL